MAEVAEHFGKTRIFGATEDVFAAFAEGIRRADRIDATDEQESDAAPSESE